MSVPSLTTSTDTQRHPAPVRALAIAAVTSFGLLMLTVTVVPNQSPILPLEIGVLMFALMGWVLARRSRAAFVAMSIFAGLLFALTLKVLLGDLIDAEGARQLATDIPLVPAVGTLFALAFTGARRA